MSYKQKAGFECDFNVIVVDISYFIMYYTVHINIKLSLKQIVFYYKSLHCYVKMLEPVPM